MRNLSTVIDQMLEIIPDDDELYVDLKEIQGSIPYTAPEAMVGRWNDVQDILNSYTDRPYSIKLVRIWNDKS